MSLRSLLLAALLAVFAASQWSDIFVSHWLNMTPTKMCAVDKPTVCVYVPKPPFYNLDPRKALVVAVYRPGTTVLSVTSLLTDYSMLQAVVYGSSVWVVINVTRPGLLYASSLFKVYSYSTKTLVSATSYTACGQTYSYAYWATPGLYNVSSLSPPLYFLDANTCISYRMVAGVSSVVNITVPRFSLYIAAFLPNTTKVYYDSYYLSWNLNGTRHVYRTFFHSRISPLGFGIYIANGTVMDTLVMHQSGADGPRAYDVLKNASLVYAPTALALLYSIGPYPGDGKIYAYIPAAPYGPYVKITHIADDTAGYATVNMSIYTTLSSTNFAYAAYVKRFAIVEVGAVDMLYTYATRGVACLYVQGGGERGAVYVLNRLDRVQEIEMCNNSTAPVVAGLFYRYDTVSVPFYFFVDRIDPGACRRLRWDSSISSKPTLRIATSETNLCNDKIAISTTSYNAGWRHFYFANGTVKPAVPISPDAYYAAAWQQLMQTMAQMYNATMNALQQWLKQQANATQSLQSLAASLPQFQGTIRMDSSTSTWLQTTLNELKKYQVSGASSSFGSASVPAVPTAVAPAAASAVAVAWAASRRDDDVVTAAAIAGIALALFGILMTLIYGTSSLTLVALGIIVAAAAAAWKKI